MLIKKGQKVHTRTRIINSLPNKDAACDLLREIASSDVQREAAETDRPIVLYGAGPLGRMAWDFFSHIGIDIAYVIDQRANELRYLAEWKGVNMLSPEDVPPAVKNSSVLAVCIATLPYAELERELFESGWEFVIPFYDIAEAYKEEHPLSNGWFLSRFSSEDVLETSKVIAGWDDDISRAHHIQFMAWRRLREEWCFSGAEVNTSNRYFIPEVCRVFKTGERFVDVGAHDGSVIEKFLNNVSANESVVWAIEPDSENRSKLVERLLAFEKKFKEIHLKDEAILKEAGVAKFYNGLGYVSKICGLGLKDVSVTSIDEMDIDPTFIKIHIEGLELDALEGALGTINKHRPIIALTSYHNADGVWKLPSWLMNKVSDYDVMMRLHSWVGTGAVIYAIPKERRANVK
jgi:FkbM family methyltransferase